MKTSIRSVVILIAAFLAPLVSADTSNLNLIKAKNQANSALKGFKVEKHKGIDLSNLPKPSIRYTGNLATTSFHLSKSLDPSTTKISSLKPKVKLKVFVSYSVPSQALKKIIYQADKLGRENVDIAFIGFKKDLGLKGTIQNFGEISKGHNVSLEIDPPSFQRFNIRKVPAFVVYKDDPFRSTTCTTQGQGKKKIDDEFYLKVYGDVTINYALNHLRKNVLSKKHDFKRFIETAIKMTGSDL